MNRIRNRSVVWRLGLTGLLALALWNPSIPWTRARPHVVVVLDDSLSMEQRLAADDWSAIRRAVSDLPDDSRFSLVRYAAEPVVEVTPGSLAEDPVRSVRARAAPPRRLALDRSSTNTQLALEAALHLPDPDERAVLLLVTDGRETHGTATAALRAARRIGVEVYLFEPGGADLPQDSWIESVQMPEQARPGERLPVTVQVGSNREGQGRLRVMLDGGLLAESPITLRQNRPSRVELTIVPEVSGVHAVEVVLTAAGDRSPRNNRQTVLVDLQAPSPVLVVTARDGPSPVVESLEGGGWAVQRINPAAFPRGAEALRQVGALVLDDIAIRDMAQSAWQALFQAVEGGTGLVVLGGPRSFAAGAYRNSELEEFLPVIAEASEPRGRAAVLFLVDKSGSMDRDQHGVSRFAYARRAVVETARTLAAGDLAGLLWFDAEPRELLPLASYENPAASIESAWKTRPSGGTLLAPALRAAAERLSESPAERRLLVVVTDGFISPAEDLAALRQTVSDAGIDVISLVIGANPQVQPLRRLSDVNDGILLYVDEVARLPRVMREEVEKRGSPARLGTVLTEQRRPLPLLADPGQWPALAGYMITRPRPGASIFLASPVGDPLLAMHHVGAARVVALPGGLGDWARAWPAWPRWGAFVGGLLEWVSARSANPYLQAGVTDRPGRLEVTVDAVTPALEWHSLAPAGVTVVDPAGQVREARLRETAPGRYETDVPAQQIGRYRLALRVGDQALRLESLHSADHEFIARRDPEFPAVGAEVQDLAIAWSPGMALDGAVGPRAEAPVRVLLVAIAAGLYLLFLMIERAGQSIRTRLVGALGALRAVVRHSI